MSEPAVEDGYVSESEHAEGQTVMPFYLILDMSGSMAGELAEVQTSMEDLVREIQADPVIDDLVMVSVIAFGSTARLEVPLAHPADIATPQFSLMGGTNYSGAWEMLADRIEADYASIKARKQKMFRSCVFFLTDGAPQDRDHHSVFMRRLGWDPSTNTGNKMYPFVIAIGFRDAPQSEMGRIAYPGFGSKKGMWFLRKDSSAKDVMTSIVTMLAKSVVSSGLSNLPQAGGGPAQPQIVVQAPPDASKYVVGEANPVDVSF